MKVCILQIVYVFNLRTVISKEVIMELKKLDGHLQLTDSKYWDNTLTGTFAHLGKNKNCSGIAWFEKGSYTNYV